jgi:histidinol dehydrogenase
MTQRHMEATGEVLPAAARQEVFRFTGALADLTAGDRRALLERARDVEDDVTDRTRAIIRRVRESGDAALRALAHEHDHVTLDRLEVPRESLDEALAAISSDVRTALTRAVANVRRAHEAWRPSPIEVEVEPGVHLERRPEPLDRVGVYAPGGRAAYPSSVVMGVVPARVAGVGEVILCSPPGPSGAPSTLVLAAALLAGADRVFAIGGAGAIAALAYGTQTVPRVDRIVGPGNAYVTAAKQLVASDVGTDTPAGPSEVLIICDESVNAEGVAREALAQAEHDPDAAVVVLTTSAGMAADIARSVHTLLLLEPRLEVIAASLGQRGALLLVPSVDDAVAFSNEWAPEHLLLAVAEPAALSSRARHAGTVFLGGHSSVVFGDYMTGANHVLPTEGAARYRSGLSTDDFVRWATYQRVTPEAARSLAKDVAGLAAAEGLPAHAAAARYWERQP